MKGAVRSRKQPRSLDAGRARDRQVSRIFVCGLDDMPHHVERLSPTRLISLVPAEEQPRTPARIRSSDHLRVLVDDVDQPDVSPAAPAPAHIELLVEFLRASLPTESILIHCVAGVSRSPAAALIAMALAAPGHEREAARILRAQGPFVSPNRLLIRLADVALGRNGALVHALESMGPPRMTCASTLLELPRWVEGRRAR